MGSVLSDVTGARRGTVLALLPPAGADRRHTVQALVPLASLIGYAGALRSQTGGEASLLQPVPATLTAATAKRSDEAPDGARACR